MIMAQNTNKIAVLATSFSVVAFIDWLSMSFHAHYFALLMSCWLIIAMCCRIKDAVLCAYALVQLVAMICYFTLLIDPYSGAMIFLYSSELSVKKIMLACELLVLFDLGLRNCLYLFSSQFFCDTFRNWTDKKRFERVLQ